MKLLKGLTAATSLFLSACASTEADYYQVSPTYSGPPSAAAQALADCRANSNMSPAMANAQANPFFAAAMQQQFIVDCMAAKGFRMP